MKKIENNKLQENLTKLYEGSEFADDWDNTPDYDENNVDTWAEFADDWDEYDEDDEDGYTYDDDDLYDDETLDYAINEITDRQMSEFTNDDYDGDRFEDYNDEYDEDYEDFGSALLEGKNSVKAQILEKITESLKLDEAKKDSLSLILNVASKKEYPDVVVFDEIRESLETSKKDMAQIVRIFESFGFSENLEGTIYERFTESARKLRKEKRLQESKKERMQEAYVSNSGSMKDSYESLHETKAPKTASDIKDVTYISYLKENNYIVTESYTTAQRESNVTSIDIDTAVENAQKLMEKGYTISIDGSKKLNDPMEFYRMGVNSMVISKGPKFSKQN